MITTRNTMMFKCDFSSAGSMQLVERRSACSINSRIKFFFCSLSQTSELHRATAAHESAVHVILPRATPMSHGRRAVSIDAVGVVQERVRHVARVGVLVPFQRRGLSVPVVYRHFRGHIGKGGVGTLVRSGRQYVVEWVESRNF